MVGKGRPFLPRVCEAESEPRDVGLVRRGVRVDDVRHYHRGAESMPKNAARQACVPVEGRWVHRSCSQAAPIAQVIGPPRLFG